MDGCGGRESVEKVEFLSKTHSTSANGGASSKVQAVVFKGVTEDPVLD